MKESKEVEEFLKWESGEYDSKISRKTQEVEDEWKQRGLLEWVEQEQMSRSDRSFYNDAVQYDNGNNFNYAVERARVLAKHYKKFRHDGKQPLFDENGSPIKDDGYVGVIFNRVIEGVKKRLDSKKSS